MKADRNNWFSSLYVENGIDGDTNSSGSSSGLNMVIPPVENTHVGNGIKRRKKERFGVQVKQIS